jgi:hypothetical protein
MPDHHKIDCSRPGCPIKASHVPVLRIALKGALIGVPPMRAVIDFPLCMPHLQKLTIRDVMTPLMMKNFESIAKQVSHNPPDFDKVELRAIKVDHSDYQQVLKAKSEGKIPRN